MCHIERLFSCLWEVTRQKSKQWFNIIVEVPVRANKSTIQIHRYDNNIWRDDDWYIPRTHAQGMVYENRQIWRFRHQDGRYWVLSNCRKRQKLSSYCFFMLDTSIKSYKLCVCFGHAYRPHLVPSGVRNAHSRSSVYVKVVRPAIALHVSEVQLRIPLSS